MSLNKKIPLYGIKFVFGHYNYRSDPKLGH